jgi:hypothetical protein
MAREIIFTKTPTGSNALSFSTLRNILNGSTSGTTKLSQYYKGTFNVPDSSTNQSVPVSGLSRVVCKITGTEYNVNTNSLFTVDGNNEYGSSLRKTLEVDGFIGASSINDVALRINPGLGGGTFQIQVNSGRSIQGHRGVGGGGGGQGGGGDAGGGGGPAIINENGGSVSLFGGGTIASGGGGAGGGGGGGRQGDGGRNFFSVCRGDFCFGQDRYCGRGVGGGGQGGAGGGTGGAGAGSLWTGSTVVSVGAQGGSGGGDPRGGSGGTGGGIGAAGGGGQSGATGPDGPGGNCQGGGAGQAGGPGGPGGGLGAIPYFTGNNGIPVPQYAVNQVVGQECYTQCYKGGCQEICNDVYGDVYYDHAPAESGTVAVYPYLSGGTGSGATMNWQWWSQNGRVAWQLNSGGSNYVSGSTVYFTAGSRGTYYPGIPNVGGPATPAIIGPNVTNSGVNLYG